jgi:putative oxidoreductase
MLTMEDVGKLILRAATGGMVAAHGAQKLFGAFEGPGLQGFAGYMEPMGLKPGRYWALAAALSEFGGGTLTALGLAWPLGPIGVMSAMSMATAKVHWKLPFLNEDWKLPIFSSRGGAELALSFGSAALALALTGPGKYSLDSAVGIQLPAWFVALVTTGAAAAVSYGIINQPDVVAAAADMGDTEAAAS